MASRFTRRKFPERSALLAAACTSAPLWQSHAGAQAASTSSAAPLPAIALGPFKGSRDSLNAYYMPDWFADAKLGIWNHWGPQSAAEYGDQYVGAGLSSPDRMFPRPQRDFNPSVDAVNSDGCSVNLQNIAGMD